MSDLFSKGPMPAITTTSCQSRSRNTALPTCTALRDIFAIRENNALHTTTHNTLTVPSLALVVTTVAGVEVEEEPPGLSNQQEAGIVIGSLLLLVSLGVFFHCCYIRHRYKPILSRDGSEPIEPSPNISQIDEGVWPVLLPTGGVTR